MPHTLSVDLDAMEGAPPPPPGLPASARYLDEGSFQPLHSAASISHAYGLSPDSSGAASAIPGTSVDAGGMRSDFVASTSSADHLCYDQDLPWPLNHLSQHPSSKHYDAHFFATSTLPRLRMTGRGGAGMGGGAGAEQSHVGSLVVTLLHSLGVHFQWAKRGLVDANRWADAWKLISRYVQNTSEKNLSLIAPLIHSHSSQQVRMGVIKGLLLSTAISLVVFFFELAFLPGQLYQKQSSASSAHDDEEDFSSGSWLNVSALFSSRISNPHPDLAQFLHRRSSSIRSSAAATSSPQHGRPR